MLRNRNLQDTEAKKYAMLKKSLITTLEHQKWRLKSNPNKREASANENINIQLGNTNLRHNKYPNFIGVTLDRTLSYRKHLENTAAKIGLSTPVWINSCHIKLIDRELNNAMRLISGPIKPTPTYQLPVLYNLLAPDRNQVRLREFRKTDAKTELPIQEELPQLRCTHT